MTAPLMTVLVAAGSVLAGILLVFWVRRSLLSSRAASRAYLDSGGGSGDRLRGSAAGRIWLMAVMITLADPSIAFATGLAGSVS